MPALKQKFKTNRSKIEDGVFFDVVKNADGTTFRVRLRRSGRTNRLWTAAYRERTAGIDTDTITAEEDELVTANIFVDACVATWENYQPEDDGVEVPFSDEAARELLTDPDWTELLKDWQAKAASLAPYQDDKVKKAEKEN